MVVVRLISKHPTNHFSEAHWMLCCKNTKAIFILVSSTDTLIVASGTHHVTELLDTKMLLRRLLPKLVAKCFAIRFLTYNSAK